MPLWQLRRDGACPSDGERMSAESVLFACPFHELSGLLLRDGDLELAGLELRLEMVGGGSTLAMEGILGLFDLRVMSRQSGRCSGRSPLLVVERY